jgi:hypothetical protein
MYTLILDTKREQTLSAVILIAAVMILENLNLLKLPPDIGALLE